MSKWGIDLGGTKIECAVIAETKEVLFRDRLPTEQEGGYEHILGQIRRLVEMGMAQTGEEPEHIGMCTPGSIDPNSGLLKNSNTVALNGRPFREDVRRVLQRPVYMENDANCLALAEYHLGILPEVAPGAESVFGVILGTGVGGGIVAHGRLLSGRNGIAGEWGHNFLDASGGDCYCGKKGCVETLISGPALERFYAGLSGEKRRLKEIVERARAGADEAARQTLQRLIHFFGYGISWVINILDPEVIVIGGGVGNIDELYTYGAEEAKKHVFNPDCRTRFVRPRLGDSGGVFGAAFIENNE